MKQLAIIPLFLVSTTAIPQFLTHQYGVGQVQFHETPKRLTISASRKPIVNVEVVPGGGLWPPVIIDQSGNINAGQALINAKNGRVILKSHSKNVTLINLGNGVSALADSSHMQLHTKNATCALKPFQFGFEGLAKFVDLIQNRDMLLAASDTEVLALTHTEVTDEESNRKEYLVWRVDVEKCQVSSPTALGDPDYLIELAWSQRGGWWISGAKEPTLLRSQDGTTWSQVELGHEISNLMSAYIVDDREMWAAAIMGDKDETYEMIVSHDGGRKWSGARVDKTTISRLPVNWFEGLRRCLCHVKLGEK